MSGYLSLILIYLFIIPQGFAIGSLFKGLAKDSKGGIIIVDLMSNSALICMDDEDACNEAGGFLRFYYDILEDRLRLEGSRDFPDPERVTAATDSLFFIDIRRRDLPMNDRKSEKVDKRFVQNKEEKIKAIIEARKGGAKYSEIPGILKKKGLKVSRHFVRKALNDSGMVRGFLYRYKNPKEEGLSQEERAENAIKTDDYVAHVPKSDKTEKIDLIKEIIDLRESGYSYDGIHGILESQGTTVSCSFITRTCRKFQAKKGDLGIEIAGFSKRSKRSIEASGPLSKKGATWDGMTLEDIDKLRTSGLRNPSRWQDDYS